MTASGIVAPWPSETSPFRELVCAASENAATKLAISSLANTPSLLVLRRLKVFGSLTRRGGLARPEHAGTHEDPLICQDYCKSRRLVQSKFTIGHIGAVSLHLAAC